MARRKSKSRIGSRFFKLLSLLLMGVSASGVGAYFNPDWPVIGPLVEDLSRRVAASTSGEGVGGGKLGGGKLVQAWNDLKSGSSANGTVPVSVQTPTRTGSVPADLASSQRSRDKLLIATFNIQVFGQSKMSKPDVVGVLVQAVRQFDVVAIQEVRAKDDDILPRFVAAINADGSRYDFLIGPRLGRSVSTEQYAFVYDTTRVTHDPAKVGTIADPADALHREPFVARFQTLASPPSSAFSFWLVNTHTDPDEVKEEVAALADVFQVMRTADASEDDVIMLGDLNADETQLGKLGQIPGITWVVSGTTTNTRRSKAYDNLLFDRDATREYTGRWGVLDLESVFGLSRDEALKVSDHLPVWAEFEVKEADARQNVAERIPAMRR